MKSSNVAVVALLAVAAPAGAPTEPGKLSNKARVKQTTISKQVAILTSACATTVLGSRDLLADTTYNTIADLMVASPNLTNFTALLKACNMLGKISHSWHVRITQLAVCFDARPNCVFQSADRLVTSSFVRHEFHLSVVLTVLFHVMQTG